MNDLFGNPIIEELPKLTQFGKKKRDETPRGYAGTPGKGPQGHFCKDCRHFHRRKMSNTYFKCRLLIAKWTGGFATDIRANSPACEHWASQVQKDPDRTLRTAK